MKFLIKSFIIFIILFYYSCISNSNEHNVLEDDFEIKTDYGNHTKFIFTTGNILEGGNNKGDDFNHLSFDFSQTISSDTSYMIIVVAAAVNILDIKKDTSLFILLDSSVLTFESIGGEAKLSYERNRLDDFIFPNSGFQYQKELALYEIPKNLLSSISNAKNVKIKIYGSNSSREYYFGKNNFKNIKEFMKIISIK